MTGIVKSGVATATRVVVNIASQMAPISITLKSDDPTRNIRLSDTDEDAASFGDVDIDITSTNSITVAALAPMKYVEFTCAIGDEYKVV